MAMALVSGHNQYYGIDQINYHCRFIKGSPGLFHPGQEGGEGVLPNCPPTGITKFTDKALCNKQNKAVTMQHVGRKGYLWVLNYLLCVYTTKSIYLFPAQSYWGNPQCE